MSGRPAFLSAATAECGLFKVGKTSRPKVRAQQMALEFRRRDATLARIRFFLLLNGGWSACEGRCVAAVTAMGGQRLPHSREWFRGIDFALACEVIAQEATRYNADWRLRLAVERAEAAQAADRAAARAASRSHRRSLERRIGELEAALAARSPDVA